ncbi:hypothetical protein H4S07_004456 [Coemansia furcata]|uniref:Uncharacterized protein n=1 Tax=Coemansia furcata TaxID=417177 RepID=A0ACC1L8A5_9FUNG|nr:hypothetical protein H4S07_004456 [Coemansia furcata]
MSTVLTTLMQEWSQATASLLLGSTPTLTAYAFLQAIHETAAHSALPIARGCAKSVPCCWRCSPLPEEAGGTLDNIDVMSDTTSMASMFSTLSATSTKASSYMTGLTALRISKNGHKEERCKICGIYEVVYLVYSLARHIDSMIDTAVFVFDEQMMWLHLNANDIPEPVPLEVNEHGLASQPRLPKPCLA